jgi:hypothetical protein
MMCVGMHVCVRMLREVQFIKSFQVYAFSKIQFPSLYTNFGLQVTSSSLYIQVSPFSLNQNTHTLNKRRAITTSKVRMVTMLILFKTSSRNIGMRVDRKHATFLPDLVNICQLDETRKLNRHAHIERYRGADKSLARSGRKQATATEDFDVHISYLNL